MSSTQNKQKKNSGTEDKKNSSVFVRYGPLCYLFFILLAILIIIIVLYFFPGKPKVVGLFNETGKAALKRFSTGSIECAK